MWYVFLFLLISCGAKKEYIEVYSPPKKPEVDPYGRIKTTDGQENQRKYLYYNSVQHKKKTKDIR
jgi:hypothetical protein